MILISDSEDEGETLPTLPDDLLMHKRVIRGKIVSERWMVQNGLEKLIELIKRQKWEKVFTKRDLVFKTECREFYKNLTVSITWTNEVAKSRVNGVNIEFDGMTLGTILDIPGNNGICDYIKEVWEESKYCKPLEITRKLANYENIVEARRVKSVEMKPFHRLLKICVMKNLVPRFGKRDVTSFMDLAYMDYLLTKKKVNLPRVIIRHMAYVINVPNHELSYGELLTRIFEAFSVPIKEKKWCVVQVEEEEELQGEEQAEKEAKGTDTGSGEKYYDAVDEERPDDVDVQVPDIAAPAPTVPETPVQPSVQQKKKTDSGVEPSGPSGNMLYFDLLHLQAEFVRALQRNI
ncbi:hypothetical protein Dimus_016474 [Dionaea muscipula]